MIYCSQRLSSFVQIHLFRWSEFIRSVAFLIERWAESIIDTETQPKKFHENVLEKPLHENGENELTKIHR